MLILNLCNGKAKASFSYKLQVFKKQIASTKPLFESELRYVVGINSDSWMFFARGTDN